MNANQLINMIMRQVMRRVIGRGVNAGVDIAFGKGKARGDMTEAERSQAAGAKNTVARARQLNRLGRRIGRL